LGCDDVAAITLAGSATEVAFGSSAMLRSLTARVGVGFGENRDYSGTDIYSTRDVMKTNPVINLGKAMKCHM
jgi:hypothetical protein